MVWRARVVFIDRATGIAGVAARAAERNVVLLHLRLVPAWGGRMADELVLHTPGGWGEDDVARFLLDAGAASVKVTVVTGEDHPAEDDAELSARLAHPAGGASRLAC